ncbi:MAG: LacI family transcriptional regulator [Chloroflexota bacterium]|nr:MAG: LacI family transcriptional regulator [Chloroflexota bacterium]
MQREKSNIHDVARKAGVSSATVSRVLAGNESVNAQLRERVLNAVALLNYRPNRVAQSLRVQRSNLIGLIIPDIQNSLFLSLARAVEDLAYTHQFTIVLCNTDDRPEKVQSYLEIMQAQQAAGLIVVPAHANDADVLTPVQAAGMPVVLVDREITGFEADTVLVNNVRGAELAVAHLIAAGYRRIAILAGPQDLTPGWERLQGYYAAHRAAGLEPAPGLVKIGTFKRDSGYELTHDLLKSSNPPDAIFAANNLMALGSIRALHERDVRIPDTVALVSFDDMPWAQDLNPPLTAVAQPSYELGQQALELLLHRMRHPHGTYRKVILQPQLIVRQSSSARPNSS